MYKYFGILTLMTGLCVSAPAAIVINEIDSDTPGGDSDEFVELKGDPGESADGLVLVFYSVNDAPGLSHHVVDLTGHTCDANGYLLLADLDVMGGGDIPQANGFIKNTEGAVALYRDIPANFPNGSSPQSANLEDVVIYRAIDSAAGDWSGFGLASPTVALEGIGGSGQAAFSLSRIPDVTGEFVQSHPTPRAPNNAEQFLDISNSFLVPRFNQTTALDLTTFVFTIQNVGPGLVTVSQFDLATTSSPQFMPYISPVLPVDLAYNQSVNFEVMFQDTSPDTNKTYDVAVNYTTSAENYLSGSYGLSRELVRFTNSAPAGSVVVNEICYAPATTDHNNDGDTTNQNDEFVELFNTTSSPILIEGWEQRCTNGNNANFQSFVFPAGATIPANGYVTVFTAGTPTGFTPGTTFTYGTSRIANGGAYVEINDGITIVDGVAYGNAEDSPDADAYFNTGVTIAGGGSIGRRPDASNAWRTFAPDDPVETDRPSPNATNNEIASVSDWSVY